MHKFIPNSILCFSIFFVGLAPVPVVLAESVEVSVTMSDALSKNLELLVGKKVSLVLTNGQELTGTVKSVGPDALHLAELSGKEFFDAVIALKDVSALVLRAR